MRVSIFVILRIQTFFQLTNFLSSFDKIVITASFLWALWDKNVTNPTNFLTLLDKIVILVTNILALWDKTLIQLRKISSLREKVLILATNF